MKYFNWIPKRTKAAALKAYSVPGRDGSNPSAAACAGLRSGSLAKVPSTLRPRCASGKLALGQLSVISISKARLRAMALVTDYINW